jgi:hypothetical protein
MDLTSAFTVVKRSAYRCVVDHVHRHTTIAEAFPDPNEWLSFRTSPGEATFANSSSIDDAFDNTGLTSSSLGRLPASTEINAEELTDER